jgi:TM2 domain-containing membrane protein YozV
MAARTATRLHDKYCGACGLKLIDPTADSCPRCEAVLGGTSSGRPKSRVAAALLAFSFGGIGAHRFYLGQWGLGLLYAVSSWTFVPSVAAFFDFVRLIAMSDERFAALHGRREGGGAVVAAVVVVIGVVLVGVAIAAALPALLAYQRALMGLG